MEANVIPHLSVRERFVSNTAVLNNGFTITGTPTINDGISGFSAANYVTLPTRSVPNTQSYSFHIDTTLPATFLTATTHILDGGATWSLEGNSGTNAITFYYDVAGGAQNVAIDCTTIMGNRVRISVAVYVSGANILAYMHIDTLSVNASDAGAMTNLPTTIRMGSDTGANFYNGTIHEFWWLKGYSLSELDHDKLVSGVFFSDLLPERSRLFMPCANSYNDGANQVTDVLGTTIPDKKAILGDGVTANTFPALLPNRFFSFDGNDYINCGDYDDFTFSLNDAFSCGVFVNVSNLAGASFPIIGKLSAFAVGGGEWVFYRNKGDLSLRVAFIDHINGGYNIIYASNTIFDNQEYYVTMVYDGSGSITVNSTRLYINGNQITTAFASAGVFTGMYNTDRILSIGSFNGASSFSVGYIGQIFLISKELSGLQIKTLYKFSKMWSYT